MTFVRTNDTLIMEAIASIGGEDRVAFQGGPSKLYSHTRVSENILDNASSSFYAQILFELSVAGQSLGYVFQGIRRFRRHAQNIH